MIHEHDIKTKDFSCVLPTIIGKLNFIGLSLTDKEAESLSGNALMGAGDLIVEIARDLEEVNNALYGNEKEAPNTKH
jgi:hypothetical protein